MADETKSTSNPSVRPGLHTIRELFRIADFDFEGQATVDYGAGEFVDHRLVRVGGLPFDTVDKVIDIPADAGKVEIEVDGKVLKALTVDKDHSDGYRSVNELPDGAELPS